MGWYRFQICGVDSRLRNAASQNRARRCTQVGSLWTNFPYLVSKTVNLTIRRQSLPHSKQCYRYVSTDSGSLPQSGAEVETTAHAGEHVQPSLGMFRYFLKGSVWGEKKEVILCGFNRLEQRGLASI